MALLTPLYITMYVYNNHTRLCKVGGRKEEYYIDGLRQQTLWNLIVQEMKRETGGSDYFISHLFYVHRRGT